MAGERAWVGEIREHLIKLVGSDNIAVQTGARLSYAVALSSYQDRNGAPDFSTPLPPTTHGYETDLLISEKTADRSGGVPRVIVEFKLDSVTTHDALTYSNKAAAHKHIHPTLRYGMVIGGLNKVPQRVIRHGVDFDFVMTLPDADLTDQNLDKLYKVLDREIVASRALEHLGTSAADIWLFQRSVHVVAND